MMRRALVLLLVVGGILAGGAPVARAQGADEIRALRQELEAIRKDLEEIKGLLRARIAGGPPAPAEPRDVAIRIDGAPTKGDAGAKVVLVEFSDFQCPFCARYVKDTLPQIERDYIKTGKVRYVMRDFPIESIHPLAFRSHVAARCAADQGRYWEMHDRLFANQGRLQPADLLEHASALGLDQGRFQACFDGDGQDDGIRADLKDGIEAGVNGTPMFFLGLSRDGEPTIKPVRVIRGAQPYTAFRQAIEAVLALP